MNFVIEKALATKKGLGHPEMLLRQGVVPILIKN
jgi:hypothetical protein